MEIWELVLFTVAAVLVAKGVLHLVKGWMLTEVGPKGVNEPIGVWITEVDGAWLMANYVGVRCTSHIHCLHCACRSELERRGFTIKHHEDGSVGAVMTSDLDGHAD